MGTPNDADGINSLDSMLDALASAHITAVRQWHNSTDTDRDSLARRFNQIIGLCRHEGATWTQIATLLGVSDDRAKQSDYENATWQEIAAALGVNNRAALDHLHQMVAPRSVDAARTRLEQSRHATPGRVTIPPATLQLIHPQAQIWWQHPGVARILSTVAQTKSWSDFLDALLLGGATFDHLRLPSPRTQKHDSFPLVHFEATRACLFALIHLHALATTRPDASLLDATHAAVVGITTQFHPEAPHGSSVRLYDQLYDQLDESLGIYPELF